jgi:hypothetical protein
MFKPLIFLFFLSFTASASECPWLNSDAKVLLSFDSDNSYEKLLSKKQVIEDLDCLKLIIENKYSGVDYFQNIDLSARIESAKNVAQDSTSLGLLSIINDIHQGVVDAHLSYSIYSGESLRFFTPKENRVGLKQDIEEEVVLEEDKYVYFRPGFLDSALSVGKQDFIKFISNNDKNIVLDLRGNGGGDDKFAEELVKALFTSTQNVPVTERIQVESPFQKAGFCISLMIHEYTGAADFCKQVMEAISGRNVSDVIPFSESRYSQVFKGARSNEYNSKIVLLIDSACASSCETIVEKLSSHPNSVLLGQNTMGALHFSNAVTFMLPNSGVIAKVPTLFHKYELDASEGVGYAPDVKLEFIDLDKL